MQNRGETIRQAREQRGWSQERLSEESGVPQSTISRLEGGGGASTENIAKLCNALRLDLSEVMGVRTYPDLPEDLVDIIPLWRSMPVERRQLARKLLLVASQDFEIGNELATIAG